MAPQSARWQRYFERRIGQLLAQTVKRGGDQVSKAKSRGVTLVDLGISKMESSRWQKLAQCDDETFDEVITNIVSLGTKNCHLAKIREALGAEGARELARVHPQQG